MNSQQKKPIFSKKFWDKPAIRTQGDPIPDGIYSAVGKMTSAWEHVEQELAGIFSMMTTSGEAISHLATSRAFGSISGNAGRRSAVKAAGEIYLQPYAGVPGVTTSLKDILNAVEWASARRDDVVHGITIPSISIGKDHMGAFLVPPEYNTQRTVPFMVQDNGVAGFRKARYTYVADDINGFTVKFWQLHTELMEYWVLLGKNEVGQIKLIDALNKK